MGTSALQNDVEHHGPGSERKSEFASAHPAQWSESRRLSETLATLGDPVDVDDALRNRVVGGETEGSKDQRQSHLVRRLSEDQSDGEDDDALRPSHNPHLTVEMEHLGARARVGDHDGAKNDGV